MNVWCRLFVISCPLRLPGSAVSEQRPVTVSPRSCALVVDALQQPLHRLEPPPQLPKYLHINLNLTGRLSIPSENRHHQPQGRTSTHLRHRDTWTLQQSKSQRQSQRWTTAKIRHTMVPFQTRSMSLHRDRQREPPNRSLRNKSQGPVHRLVRPMNWRPLTGKTSRAASTRL